jgi:putative membrane protein
VNSPYFRQIAPLTALVASLAIAGCASKDKTTADSANGTAATSSASTAMGSTPAAPTDSAPASADPSHFSDANILATEIAGDSGEVAIATLAKEKATSPAVKAYASLLVSDHAKGLNEAKALAQKIGITPEPPAGDTTAQAVSHALTRLQGLPKGAAFDTAFVNHEIEDHKQDIKEAQAMSGAAQNAQVKAAVQKALPELQKHLDRAEKIAGTTPGKA